MQRFLVVVIAALTFTTTTPITCIASEDELGATIQRLLNFATYDSSLVDKDGSILVVSGDNRHSYTPSQQATYVAQLVKLGVAPIVQDFKILGEMDADPIVSIIYEYSLSRNVGGASVKAFTRANDVWEHTPSGWRRLSTVIYHIPTDTVAQAASPPAR